MQSERVSANYAGSKTAHFAISKGKTTFKVKASKKNKKYTIYVKATSKANKNRKAGTKTVKIVVR